MSDRDDLHDELTDIRGVGDATAEQILDVLNAHTEATADDASDETDPLLSKALTAAERRNDRQAAVFLRRYVDRND
jgi:ribosomal protein S13